MNRIEKMIADLCPNGVESKELWEVCIDKFWIMPSTPKFIEDGKVPYITSKNIKGGKIDLSTAKYISNDDYIKLSKNREIYSNDILISMIGTVGEIYIVEENILPIYGQNMYLVRLNSTIINIRYFYHYFLSATVRKHINKNIKTSSQGYLKAGTIDSIKLPIPPLEIQEEIVKVLDTMSEHVTELQSELQLRTKQYEYYREDLLTFENHKVEWKTLGEVADFKYGYTDKAQDVGTHRFIRITDIDDNGYLKVDDKKYVNLREEAKQYQLKKNDLLMARTGATYGKTLFFNSDEPAIYASFLIKINLNQSLLSRYYWHFSKSNLYWKQANNLVSKAGQPQFNANALKQVKIPIPSLEIQEKIVYVLDNFDKVCNDLNIGLPKEVELRQKEYEYYREKLLTFDKEFDSTHARTHARTH